MPEAAHALAQCAIYLALAPKSNAAYKALGAARAYVREHGAAPPPPPALQAPAARLRLPARPPGPRQPAGAAARPGRRAPASTRPTTPRRPCASACKRSCRRGAAERVGAESERAFATMRGVVLLFRAHTLPSGLRVRVRLPQRGDLRRAARICTSAPGARSPTWRRGGCCATIPARACGRLRHGLGRRRRAARRLRGRRAGRRARAARRRGPRARRRRGAAHGRARAPDARRSRHRFPATMESLNPATGERVGAVTATAARDVAAVVAQAARGQRRCGRTCARSTGRATWRAPRRR